MPLKNLAERGKFFLLAKNKQSKMKFKHLFLLLIISSFFLSPFLALAEITEGERFPNPIKSNNFTELVTDIIQWLANIGILVAVIMIIYSGLLFMASGGKEEKLSQAKKTFTWAMIGLAVLIIGEGFIGIIKSILNVNG